MATFTLEVIGGLCSRFRAVAGALAYCEATKKALTVNWPRAEPSEPLKEFPCRYSDLWECDFDERDARQGLSKDARALRQSGNVQLRTCEVEPFLPWIPDIHAAFRWPKSTKAVVALIATAAGNLPSKDRVLGIQLRAAQTDPNTKGVDWFIAEAQRREFDAIFLAVDNAAAKTQFDAAFPGKIIAFDRQRLNRPPDPDWYIYDADSVLKQAAELYVLADYCGYVIGSNHSSFSQTVAFLRGATYTGTHERPGGLGNLGVAQYHDAWNMP